MAPQGRLRGRAARPKAPSLRVSALRQEAGRSIEKALLLPSKAKWEAALALALGDGVVLVASHTLAALHIAVFARRPLLPLLSAARTAQALADSSDDTEYTGDSYCPYDTCSPLRFRAA